LTSPESDLQHWENAEENDPARLEWPRSGQVGIVYPPSLFEGALNET